MPEVDEQIRRYARDVIAQTEAVTSEQVRSSKRPRGSQPRERWQLVGAAVVVMVGVAAVVGWLVNGGDPAGVELAAPPAEVADWGPARQVVADEDTVWVVFGAPAKADQPPQGPGGIARLTAEQDGVEAVAEIADLAAVAVADHPEGASLWAARRPGELVRLDATTGEVQARIDLPAAPGFDDIDGEFLPNGVVATPQAVWVTTARGFAALVSPAQNELSEIVELVPDYPGGGTAHGPVAWFSQGPQGVGRVDALASHPLQTIDPEVEGEPGLIITTLAYHNGRLWLGGPHSPRDADTGAIWALDPDRGTVLGTATTDGPVSHLASAGDTVWAAGQRKDHAAAWQVPADLDGYVTADHAPAFPTGAPIVDLLATDGSLWALVDPANPVLLRLDPDSGELIDSLPLPANDTSQEGR